MTRTWLNAMLTLAVISCGKSPSSPGGGLPDMPDAATGELPRDAFTALAALPGMCTADGWCWRTPSPHGNDYVRVFSTTPDNIWLTARQGTVMQWDGRAWTSTTHPCWPASRLRSSRCRSAGWARTTCG